MIRITGLEERVIEPYQGETPSGERCAGERFYVFLTDDNLNVTLRIAHTDWENSEREIQCVHSEGHDLLRTIEGRLRLSIYDYNEISDIVTLKKSYLKVPMAPHSNLTMASVKELEGWVEYISDQGIPEDDWLRNCEWGRKESLINDDSTSRNYAACLFPKQKLEVPIYWFYITRALPLIQ